MSELRIRNIDPWIVDIYRDRAKKHGQSMENEIRDTLARLAVEEMKQFLGELRVSRAQQREKHGLLPDSAPGIRAEREAM